MMDLGGLVFCEWLRFISTSAGPWGLQSEQQSCHIQLNTPTKETGQKNRNGRVPKIIRL